LNNYVGPANWPDYHVSPTNGSATSYAVINNGVMHSVGELGNIYDPHRKRSSESKATINSARGGGRTLKIGQTDDLIPTTRFGAATASSVSWYNAAWRLTDIFCVDTDRDIVMAPATTRAKLNINGVLRDSGVAFRGLLKSFVFLPSPDGDSARANKPFIDAEIDNLINDIKDYQRTNGPMMDRGEMSQMDFFNGSGSSNTAGTQASSTSMDRSREEIFRRIAELITTRSASYTVYCVGEAVRQGANGDIERQAITKQRVSFRCEPTISDVPLDGVTGYATKIYANQIE
jgi:hypothetical protein